jgi:hypothetical protein
MQTSFLRSFIRPYECRTAVAPGRFALTLAGKMVKFFETGNVASEKFQGPTGR